MVDKRPEWYPPEEIEHQIYSAEHSRDQYTLRLEVRPECDSEPQEHIGKASYGWVGEDMREEARIMHRGFYK